MLYWNLSLAGYQYDLKRQLDPSHLLFFLGIFDELAESSGWATSVVVRGLATLYELYVSS